MNTQKRGIVRLIAMIMIIVTLIPMGIHTSAAEMVQPRASYYLDTYNAYVYPAGGSDITVYFDVMGTGYMDELGVLRIEIYESTDCINWEWVDTFRHNTTSGMLSYNDNFHAGSVTYDGIVGRYYKAYVCVWGGKDGKGDTRYFWTSPKKAT